MKAFTMIELIFIIVIIGIIAAVAIPKMQGHKTNVVIEKSLKTDKTTEWK